MAFKDKKADTAYHTKWDNDNTRRFGLKFMRSTGADLIQFLESTPNKQGIIKAALRYYIAAGCPEVEKEEGEQK